MCELWTAAISDLIQCYEEFQQLESLTGLMILRVSGTTGFTISSKISATACERQPPRRKKVKKRKESR
jgi:hypothetical protein